MPRVSRRMKYKRIYCCYTRIDRRICPLCGDEVTKWNFQGKVEHCFRCRKALVWDAAKKVQLSRVRGRPTLKFCGRGSPAMSTVEECNESGEGHSRRSSWSSPIDDDLCTPDNDSLRSWITVTSQDMGSSINDDSDGDAVIACESIGPDTKDDTVPARMTSSTLPKDEQLTMNTSDTTNENDTVSLLPATAVPEPITDAPHPTSPRPISSPRITSPSPTSPRASSPSSSSPRPSPLRLIPKKKTCRFRQRFRRKRREPMEPSPSLEDLISIPEVVPQPRAAELLNTLVLARTIHERGVVTEPVTTSSALESRAPDDILQQHAADLDDALAQLELLGVDGSDEEGFASSRRSSFWSQIFCFL